MWPFRRKQEELDNVPSEIKEYYQAEQRERMGLAWLLAAVTLVVTVMVVLGLFFGGRVIYRRVANKNKVTVATTQPQSKTPTKASKPTSGSSKTASKTPSNTSAKATTKVTSGPASTPKKVAVSKPPVAPAIKTSPASSTTKTITNTGPAGTLAAFMVASVAGFSLYELRLRRKFSE